MSKTYAIDFPRGFNNEFMIVAFDTAEARDAYELAEETAEAVTRTVATRRLRGAYRGDYEFGGSINCYPGSKSHNENEHRFDEIKTCIEMAIEDGRWIEGASKSPVEL